jgi:hypothetical protein
MAEATEATPVNVVTATRLRVASTRVPAIDGANVRYALATPAPATTARLDAPQETVVTVTVEVWRRTRAPVIVRPAPAMPTPPTIEVTTPLPVTEVTATVLDAAVTVDDAASGILYAATPTPPTAATICPDELIAATVQTELTKLTDNGESEPGVVIEATPTQPALTWVAIVVTALVVRREFVTLTEAARTAELVAAAMPTLPAIATLGYVVYAMAAAMVPDVAVTPSARIVADAMPHDVSAAMPTAPTAATIVRYDEKAPAVRTPV